MSVRPEYYKDHVGKWRWKLVGRGVIIAASSQGFTRKWSAKRNAALTLRSLTTLLG